MLSRPSTLLSVQLVGAPAGALQALSSADSFSVVTRPLVGSSTAVAAALQPLPGLLLDTECGVACDAACLAEAVGAQKLGGLEAPSAHPLLQELACLLAAARAQADSDEPLLSARLVAFPALLEASPESAQAAGAALASTLAAALQALDKRAGGAVAQLVLLEEMPQEPLRQLLATSSSAAYVPPPPPPAVIGGYRDVNAWYGKVAGFGVGVLVATAAVGAVIALCTLPTGQDALLYARTKGD